MEAIQQIIDSSSGINLIDDSVDLIFSYLFFGGYFTIVGNE